MDEGQKKKLLVRLQNLCVRRECCEADIYEKALKLTEGDNDIAAEFLQSLVKDRFVSNARYASAYAREKAQISGWGPIKIRFMLHHKGIDDLLITEALNEVDEDRADYRLERLLYNKYKQIASDPNHKIKLIKYALGRGYDYEIVKKVLEKVINQ